MINSVLLLILVVLVICLTSSAIGLIIASNFKSHLLWSIVICFFLPIIGQIVIAIKTIPDKKNLEIPITRKKINK